MNRLGYLIISLRSGPRHQTEWVNRQLAAKQKKQPSEIWSTSRLVDYPAGGCGPDLALSPQIGATSGRHPPQSQQYRGHRPAERDQEAAAGAGRGN